MSRLLPEMRVGRRPRGKSNRERIVGAAGFYPQPAPLRHPLISPSSGEETMEGGRWERKVGSEWRRDVQEQSLRKEKLPLFSPPVLHTGFPGGASGKEPACQCRIRKRCGFKLWFRKSPWRRAWNPLQHSCLENLMDRGAWRATAHRVAKSRTRLEWLACVHAFHKN